MWKSTRQYFDAFSFSLGGLTAIASVVTPPIVAADRINRAWDERLSQAQPDEQCQDDEFNPAGWPELV